MALGRSCIERRGMSFIEINVDPDVVAAEAKRRRVPDIVHGAGCEIDRAEGRLIFENGATSPMALLGSFGAAAVDPPAQQSFPGSLFGEKS